MDNNLKITLTRKNRQLFNSKKILEINHFPIFVTGSSDSGKKNFIFNILTQLLEKKEGFIYLTPNTDTMRLINEYIKKNIDQDIYINSPCNSYLLKNEKIINIKCINPYDKNNIYFLDIINPFIGNIKYFEFLFDEFGKILSIILDYLKTKYDHIPLNELFLLDNLKNIEDLNKTIKSPVIDFFLLKQLGDNNIFSEGFIKYTTFINILETHFTNTDEKKIVPITDLYSENSRTVLNFLDYFGGRENYFNIFINAMYFIDKNKNFNDKKTFILNENIKFHTNNEEYYNNYIFSNTDFRDGFKQKFNKINYKTIIIFRTYDKIEQPYPNFFSEQELNYAKEYRDIRAFRDMECIIFLREEKKIIPYHYIKLDKNDYFL